MALTTTKVYRGVIPTVPAILFTVPVGKKLLLKTVDFSNATGASQTVSVYLLPVSEPTANNRFLLVPGTTVTNGEFMQWSGFQVLEAGDKILASASVTDMSIHISGALEDV